MNDYDNQLRRLFRSARPGARRSEDSVPIELRDRVMVAWRLSAGADPIPEAMQGVLRAGLWYGGIILLSCLAWTCLPLNDVAQDEMAQANYQFRMKVMP